LTNLASTPHCWTSISREQVPADIDGKAILDAGAQGRMQRRREDTRRRLMKATYEIIARRGLEGLVIQDITEAADVGYGSFYNHFRSKEAIVGSVVDAASARVNDIYECMGRLTADRAESFARYLRMSLYLSQKDKLWGWFMIRTVLSSEELHTSIRANIQRGINAGLGDGVFKHEDIEMACESIGGLFLFGLLKLVSGKAPDDYLDKIVTTALKSLGVRNTDITEIMSRQLPELNLPPFLDATNQGGVATRRSIALPG
jgi:AcrR family transcriptional regulator